MENCKFLIEFGFEGMSHCSRNSGEVIAFEAEKYGAFGSIPLILSLVSNKLPVGSVGEIRQLRKYGGYC